MMSTVATFSVTQAGWTKPKGISTTPKPSRISFVVRAILKAGRGHSPAPVLA
jgi:hypothetical protein